MGNVKHRIEDVIGHTPILELDGLEKKEQLDSHILVKLESVNPFGSLKDRIAVAIIDRLEEETDIKPGDTLVEFSSGNTVIALAAIAAKRGYKMLAHVVQPTDERIKLLEAYGATVVLMENAEPELLAGMEKCTAEYDSSKYFLDYYKEKSEREGTGYYPTVQSYNEANRDIQYNTTGQEIIADVDQVDVLIAGIGSGGSITGVSEALREKFPNLEVVAFEPVDDDMDALVGVHSITQTPEPMFPQIVLRRERCPYDRIVKVDKEDAYRTANEVAKTDGIFLGITSGAAIYLAKELAKQPEYKDKTIVTFGYDDVLKYLTTPLVDKKYKAD